MTDFRAYGDASPPTAAATDDTGYTFGLEFSVTSDAWLKYAHFWQPSTNSPSSTIRTAALFDAVTQELLVPAISFSVPVTGWNTAEFSPYLLDPGRRYKLGVHYPGGRYALTAGYFSSGPGSVTQDFGLLRIYSYNDSTTPGQNSFIVSGSISYPSQGLDANLWIDVTVTDADPDVCSTQGRTYVEVDWDGDDSFFDTYDDVSGLLTQRTAVTMTYGRDDARALSPVSAGVMAFELCDPEAIFSAENPDSPIVQDVAPGRTARLRVNKDGNDNILFTGRIETINTITSKYSNNVPVSVYDGLADLQGTEISTELYQGIKTGEAMSVILDEIGWPINKRRIDTGSTTIPWWWEDRTSAFVAAQRLVSSEGPPSIVYIDPGTGDFVFEDRQHRLLRTETQEVQATFCVDLSLGTCGATGSPCPVTGSYAYTDPFQYDSGIRDIINSVSIDVKERSVDRTVTPIWQLENPIQLADETVIYSIAADGEDPFIDAEANVDFTAVTFGATVTVTFSRTSGKSLTAFVTVVGSVIINALIVQAYLVTVARVFQVTYEEPGSIAQFGRRSYPNEIVWCGRFDAAAIAELIATQRAFRRATVRVRVVNNDDETVDQLLQRVIGDRVRLINTRYRLDDSFIIERIERTIVGRGRIHAVVFACERVPTQLNNAFTFDVPELGFDNGVFGLSGFVDPDEIFIFGEAGRGFDDGRFSY